MIMNLLEYKSTATKVYFGVYALETYLNARQHRKLLETEVPEELEGVVSKEEFEKDRLFELRESHYRLVKSAWKVAKDIAFIQYDIYPLIWKYSSELLVKYFNLSGTHWYTDYFIVAAIFPIADAIAILPVMLYDFLVLKRHKKDSSAGSRSVRSPPQDNINLGISIVLDILPQLYFISQGVPNAYLYAMPFRLIHSAIDVLLLELVTQYFLNTEPLREDDLYFNIKKLAKDLGFNIDNLFVFQRDLQDPEAPDVYIFENFTSKTIYLSDTIIEEASDEEICALVTRELIIRKSRFGLKKFILNEACCLALIYSFSKVMQNQGFYQQFGISAMPIIFGATMFKTLIAPLKPVANFFFNLITRKKEIKANSFVKSGQYGKHLKSGLLISYVSNKKNFNTDPLFSAYRSHNMSLAENLKSIIKTE
ncbi:hypothetical protein CONCODRAFT_84020 [Conidiobolus coronatus NRRL 28638]|uniref:Uncharacterized protein n=1 Tax=Conidiobolus coronatus (strain ATCC 28846 / CBS 209.66 / NRRL 28638) TaxID=796925 RepID=A0A137PBW3_CONC2|nr:hypothetical protein CONCODRAFT_84020 [Conidiobolus coronatus NRRL 28638]|eukprot:KXN72476.1 hypothetical protein CONCODRAFT_84020 [Conidiobolus coronatus NRRL 28638]